MPNWVFNELKINKKYKNLIFNEKEEVDFKVLCPIPEGFDMNLQSPQNNTAIYVYCLLNHDLEWLKKLTRGEHPKIDFIDEKTIADVIWKRGKDRLIRKLQNLHIPTGNEDNELSITLTIQKLKGEKFVEELEEEGKKYCKNYELAKEFSWYDLQYSLCSLWGIKWKASDTDIIDEIEDEIMVRFDTPWGPPHNWIMTLVKKNIPFSLIWEEESGLLGKYECDVNKEQTILKDMSYPGFAYIENDDVSEYYNETVLEYPQREDIFTIKNGEVIDHTIKQYSLYTIEDAEKLRNGEKIDYKQIS